MKIFGHQDQRDCCGCNRKQRDHAGGLGPPCLGRPPDHGGQASKWTASFHHGYFLSVGSASRSACLTGAMCQPSAGVGHRVGPDRDAPMPSSA